VTTFDCVSSLGVASFNVTGSVISLRALSSLSDAVAPGTRKVRTARMLVIRLFIRFSRLVFLQPAGFTYRN